VASRNTSSYLSAPSRTARNQSASAADSHDAVTQGLLAHPQQAQAGHRVLGVVSMTHLERGALRMPILRHRR